MDSQLIKVCKSLYEGKCPRDDTLLEKLITSLTSNTHDDLVKSIAKSEEFKELLVLCSQEVSKLDTNGLASVLRIAGVVSEKYFELLDNQEGNLVIDLLKNSVQCTSVSNDKSVANGVMFSLEKVFSVPNRILEFFVPEFLTFIKLCVNDSSLFVSKAAVNLLACLTVGSMKICDYENRSSECTENGTHKLKGKEGAAINDIQDMVMYYMTHTDLYYVKISLSIILQIFHHTNDVQQLKDLAMRYNINSYTRTVLKIIGSRELNSYLEVLTKMKEFDLFDEETKAYLISFPDLGAESDHRLVVVKICSWLLKYGDNTKMNDIEKIILDVFTCTERQLNKTSSRDGINILLHCIKSFCLFKHELTKAKQIICSGIIDTQQSIIFRNHKLLNTCFNTLISIVKANTESPDKLVEILSVCCVVLRNDLGYQIVSQIYSCIIELLRALTDRDISTEISNQMSEQLRLLGSCLPEKLMNIKWEIRDATLEFLGSLVTVSQLLPSVWEWIQVTDIFSHIWQSIDDGESYVRSSAIAALLKWLSEPNVCEFVVGKVSSDSIFTKIINIARTDEEGFPRRAAVDCLSLLYRNDTFKSESNRVIDVMCSAIYDLDWEIKMKALQFWDGYVTASMEEYLDDSSIISEEMPGKRKSVEKQDIDMFKTKLENLQKVGFISVLLTAISDYDKSVQEKACEMLSKLKYQCDKYCIFNEIGTKKIKLNCNDINVSNIQDYVQQFPAVLEAISESLHVKHASEPLDDYEDNLQSLIDDILVALGSCSGDADNQDGDNAAAVDCY